MASYLPPTLGSVFNATPFLYGANYLSLQEAFKYFLPQSILSQFFSASNLTSSSTTLTIPINSKFQNNTFRITENITTIVFSGTPSNNQIKLVITGDVSTFHVFSNETSTPGQLPILFNGGGSSFTINTNTIYLCDIYTDNVNWYFKFTQY
jgi:hypothetical protein